MDGRVANRCRFGRELTTPSTLPDLRSFTKSGVSQARFAHWSDFRRLIQHSVYLVRYVQAGSRVESILAKIREAIGGGVDYAEDKLSSVLEVSLSRNLAY